jgi:hypothetical protein
MFRKRNAIKNLENQKRKLLNGDTNKVWIGETSEFIKMYLGECEQYKTIQTLQFKENPLVYEMTSFLKFEEEKKLAIKILDSCILLIQHNGLIKKPTINFIQKLSDGALATIICFAIPALIGIGYYFGQNKFDKDYYQNLEIKKGNDSLKKHMELSSYRNGIDSIIRLTKFNTDLIDFPLLQVSNFTHFPDCGTCWSEYAEAKIGEIISVEIYYHNTGEEIARNVITKLQGFSHENYFFSAATLWANNTSTNCIGSCLVKITDSKNFKAIFNKCTWYASQKNMAESILSDKSKLLDSQDGSEIISEDGLYLGDIKPEWINQGVIVVQFKIVSNK